MSVARNIAHQVKLAPDEQSLVPAAWGGGVRAVKMSECRVAGRSLALAFAEDPLSCYLVGAEDAAHWSDEKRWAVHEGLMTAIVAAHVRQGLVTTTGPDYDAIALWNPPGKNVDSYWNTFHSGLWRSYMTLSREGRRRYGRALLHQAMADVMGDRVDSCIHLVWIGTKPNSRRKGLATRLVRSMLAKADAERLPVYLESSSIANNEYYEHEFGFEVKRIFYTGERDVSPPLFMMVREPQPISKIG